MTHPSGVNRLGAALAVALIVLAVQVTGAALTGSLALLMDTAHLAGDTVGLIIALAAAVFSQRPASARNSWGLGRLEILGAVAQAVLLLVVSALVVVEAVRRIISPVEVDAQQVVWFGVAGLLGNIIMLVILTRGPKAHRSLNLRAATLEVLADTLGSIAVIISAVWMLVTGFGTADVIAAVLIGVLIVPRALRVLSEAVRVLLESTPPGVSLDHVRAHLAEVDHVLDVHDLHISRVSSHLPVLTAHVVVEDAVFDVERTQALLHELNACVAQHFAVPIEHTTFQLEPASTQCSSDTYSH